MAEGTEQQKPKREHPAAVEQLTERDLEKVSGGVPPQPTPPAPPSGPLPIPYPNTSGKIE
jgi:hypothetical protein